MTATLSPLPSPSPGLPARIVTAQNWSTLPSPSSRENPPAMPATASLPAWPTSPAPTAPSFPTSWPAPAHPEPAPPAAPAEAAEAAAADFTDDDLRDAFAPIVEAAVRKAVYAKENGIDTYLEPMLRATIRRALAEYAPAARPFRAPATYDRFIWHLQALFTSRTYEDIIFEKTHRFQVEEVFLVDAASLALVSFASCDPARHASAKRVTNTVQRIALQLRDDAGKPRESIELPDHRHAITRAGRFVILIAVVRGQPSELILSDLEFALRRIEDRFREQFQQKGSPLLLALQPFLEDCLLIQSPASAA
jgi:hypothetical protein